MKTIAIVPAAGCGKRLGSKIKKPFVLLGGKPLVIYALTALDSSAHIDAILVAAERSCIGRFRRLVKEYKFKKVIGIVPGGATRFESVANCLKLVGPSYDIVLIHDGARPFVDKRMIEESIRMAARFGGCVAAVAENDTVKLAGADLFIARTLDRRRIFRAQTPQSFRRELMVKAYKVKNAKSITDDAGLVELIGGKIRILEGSYRNIKITTREDLKLAEVLL